MDPSIAEKIRKLHALAERPGTVAEGMTAAAILEELCRKYNIDPERFLGGDWRKNFRRFVTEIRFETEHKVYESKTYSYEIEHIFGPCLACAIEIEYVKVGQTWGKKWIQEQFEPHVRVELLQRLEAGRTTKPSFSRLRNLLCASCRDKFGAIELQKRKEKQYCEWQKWEERRKREEWESTWRVPAKGEFKRRKGHKTLFATMGDIEHKIVFRWRISNRCQCRGNKAGAAVGMWVDRKLVAHYFGWDLTTDDRYSGEYQDRFGTGFELWFERKFQLSLLQATPDMAWNVLDRRLMREMDESASWLAHFTWHDGSKYAKVGPLQTLAEVRSFARQHLGMVITSDRKT